MNAVLTMRAAAEADLPAILAVEASWPEAARAGPDKFLARLRKFPEGFFVASVPGAGGQPVLVATITSMPMHYRASSVGHLGDWDVVTNHGYLPDALAADYNALYIVSGVIDVLADYFPDDASRNYSAMVVRNLRQRPLITSPN
jgi:hypothetical protein